MPVVAQGKAKADGMSRQRLPEEVTMSFQTEGAPALAGGEIGLPPD
jgi:hypothetical protein